MNRRALLQGAGASAMLARLLGVESFAQAVNGAAFELRVYYVSTGKLPALLERFRDYTAPLFARHGIVSLGYWTSIDEDPLKEQTLFYLLKYPDREQARVRWKAFEEDPEWVAVRKASEADGKLVERVESTFLKLDDFSPSV